MKRIALITYGLIDLPINVFFREYSGFRYLVTKRDIEYIGWDNKPLVWDTRGLITRDLMYRIGFIV